MCVAKYNIAIVVELFMTRLLWNVCGCTHRWLVCNNSIIAYNMTIKILFWKA